ncbi:MAG: AmmeMemoRadiSam system protein B [Anaerolineales bacterium]|nr:AmmeMemoRadiSam system protein B [Anaerolineales bacterium]
MVDVLAEEYRLDLPHSDLASLLSALDDAFLLENEKASQAKADALASFHEDTFRPALLAGNSYPASGDELRDLFNGYTKDVGTIPSPHDEIRGIVSPHIDFVRGWRVYGSIWNIAKEQLRSAELVIILGTDHYGPDRVVTLTHQNYATPFGVLPTNREVVDQIADAVGRKHAFHGELHHRGEHSIELAAAWLHYIRDGEPCDLLPILCGSFAQFVKSEDSLEDDELIANAVEALRTITSKRRTLIVAAADIAHVGPAFGGLPLDLRDHAALHAEDRKLMRYICDGDPLGFVNAIRDVQDQFNVCGTAPIYLAMQALAPVSGECIAYEHCPADESDTSAVSICGIVFH